MEMCDNQIWFLLLLAEFQAFVYFQANAISFMIILSVHITAEEGTENDWKEYICPVEAVVF